MITKSTIARIRSLSTKKGRETEGLFIAEGGKMAAEMLGSGFHIEEIFVRATDRSDALEKIARHLPDGLQEAAEVVQPVSPKEMERISQLKTPSEVLLTIQIPGRDRFPTLEEGLFLALDGVQDPGNLGTIIRIADWFGISGIFCSEGTADCFNPKVVQATMGSIARVPLRYGDLGPVLEKAAAEGIPVYGAFLDGENLYEAGLPSAGIVVLGSEGGGISPEVAVRIARRITIPSFSRSQSAESLNVAVAAAVICSELRRGEFLSIKG